MSLCKKRIEGGERRRLIVEAVTPLFAQKGFAGVTTREIAAAAGVSEALVFRHFPTKAALYQEITQLGMQGDPDLERLETLEPSTETLVLMVYGLVRHMVRGELGDPALVTTRLRLVLHSMMEDGGYARHHFASVAERVLPTFRASLLAARVAGDVRPGGPEPADGFWFGCHIAAFIALGFLPGRGLFPYDHGEDIEALTTEAARFVLRGIGLREELVQAPFDPAKLEVLSGRGRSAAALAPET